jgi:hypothetical protein
MPLPPLVLTLVLDVLVRGRDNNARNASVRKTGS